APQGGFQLQHDGQLCTTTGEPLSGRFLAMLDHEWRAARCRRPTSPSLPFRGGWALLLGYELAGQIEPKLRLPQQQTAVPVALALRCVAAIVRDRRSGLCTALIEQDTPEAALRLTSIAEEFAGVRALAPLTRLTSSPLPVSED